MKGKTMSSGPNMLKFILGKGQGPANEREKVQKQLFGFSREVNHGFPNKPSCLAWDPILRIIGKLNSMISFNRHTLEFKLEMCFFFMDEWPAYYRASSFSNCSETWLDCQPALYNAI